MTRKRPSNEPPQQTLYLLAHSVLDRHAYRLLLHEQCGLEVVVDSDFTPTAVWSAMRARPDIVLVVADSPRSDVIEAVEMILRLRPGTRVLVVSSAVDPNQIEPWGRCHLAGYVVKGGGDDELRAGIEAVLRGGHFFSQGIQAALNRGADQLNGGAKLSRREAELLPLLARGHTLREAAERMSVSYKTADSYRTSLLRKLGIHDRIQLTRYAIRQRIIDP